MIIKSCVRLVKQSVICKEETMRKNTIPLVVVLVILILSVLTVVKHLCYTKHSAVSSETLQQKTETDYLSQKTVSVDDEKVTGFIGYVISVPEKIEGSEMMFVKIKHLPSDMDNFAYTTALTNVKDFKIGEKIISRVILMKTRGGVEFVRIADRLPK